MPSSILNNKFATLLSQFPAGLAGDAAIGIPRGRTYGVYILIKVVQLSGFLPFYFFYF